MSSALARTRFVALGVNHWRADLATREAFTLTSEQQAQLLEEARLLGIRGLVVVSTCNRTEVFAHTDCQAPLTEAFLRVAGVAPIRFLEHGFVMHGQAALRHLFHVATGLNSLILGDLQIVQQVKQAYKQSEQAGMLDGYMHKLFQQVFKAHKRARHETEIGSGAASVAHAAVQMIREVYPRLEQVRILLVGAGKIGKVTCGNLLRHGAAAVTVMNRTAKRAERLSGRFSVRNALFDELEQEIAQHDVVVAATGAQKCIIGSRHIAEGDKQKLFIDLSVPRNIDPAVGQLPGIRLIDMDSLAETMDEAYAQRDKSRPAVAAIIEEELMGFGDWLALQKLAPTIKALTEKFEAIKQGELDFFRNKIGAEAFPKAEQLADRVLKKVMAHSIEHLRANAEQGERVASLVQAMFQLEVEED